MWNRRKKWRVSFDENAVKRRVLSRFPNLLRFREGNISSEGNHETHVESTQSMLPGAGEAVEDSTQTTGGPLLSEHGQAFVPGVIAALRRSAVDHDRQLDRARQFHLFEKDNLLYCSRRMVVVIIQSDLAPGDDLGPPG